jgi:DNA-binding sugar fermentation-stimulating protein
VLRQGCHALYPDCPSAQRGKHVKELIELEASGNAATIQFVAALLGMAAFKPNGAGDPY